MNRAGLITATLLGLTTWQVLWGWLHANRSFTRLSLVVWLFFLGALSAYYLLLRAENFSEPVKKVHRWIFSQMTGRHFSTLGILFLGAYSVWYACHIWGKSLIAKDFGAFFYRNILLDQLFPSIVGYNPFLNGGYQTIELLTTGSVNLFLLTYPIAAVFSVEAAFKTQPILVIILLPVLIYISGKLLEFSHAESFFSAAFALVLTPIGHMGFGHMLFHGTLPYIFSCELAIVVFALSYRVFILGRDAAWGIPLIILLGSLASLHPVFLLIMGPLAVLTVIVGTIPFKRKLLFGVVIGIGLLAAFGIWFHELLFYDRGQLITERVILSRLPLQEWLEKLAQNFFGLQVPLVIASMVGLRRLMRDTQEAQKIQLGRLLLFAILYYTFLSSLGYFVVASLQPMRFVVPLSFFLSLALGPSWLVVKSLWTRMEREEIPSSLILNATLCMLMIFLCLPYSTFFVGFPTASPTTFELVRWLRENVNDNGRVFIFVPDQGAHNTPLRGQIPFYQAKTERSLMGVPAAAMGKASIAWIQDIGDCLKSPKSAVDCRDLYNIRYAVTFLENGHSAPVSLPKDDLSSSFRLIKTIGGVQIYESIQSSSYFVLGRGEVKQYLNRIAVAAEPSEFVVLKFFWAPGLTATPPLALERYPLPNGKAFIKIRSDFRRNFEILYQ